MGAYFAVSDAKSELSLWDSRLQVTSRGYMLGYNDLRDPSVSGFFRFLARVGDGVMKMQIVKIGFGGRTMKETCFQNIRAVVMAQGIEKNITNPRFPLFVKF